MSEPIVYPCGCVNTIDPKWNILRNVAKCQKHLDAAGKMGQQHYLDMHCIEDGIPQHSRYEEDLLDACRLDLAQVSRSEYNDTPSVLEIGAGLGMYCPMFLRAGWRYRAIEPDPWAANWIRSTFGVSVDEHKFGSRHTYALMYDMIIAAHVFEHMVDGPDAIIHASQMLYPGGQLVIIVPDDEDPVNPDHLWFFTPGSVERVLQQAQMKDIRIEVRRRVKYEQFIYATARK